MGDPISVQERLSPPAPIPWPPHSCGLVAIQT